VGQNRDSYIDPWIDDSSDEEEEERRRTSQSLARSDRILGNDSSDDERRSLQRVKEV
jgi:hypothetical protein